MRRMRKKRIGFHVSSEVLYMMVLHHNVQTTVHPVLTFAGCLCTSHGVDRHLFACAVAALLASSTSSSLLSGPQSKDPHTALSFIHFYFYDCVRLVDAACLLVS